MVRGKGEGASKPEKVLSMSDRLLECQRFGQIIWYCLVTDVDFTFLIVSVDNTFAKAPALRILRRDIYIQVLLICTLHDAEGRKLK